MPKENEYPRTKIADPDLRSFADADAEQQRSVLIELEAEPPEVVIGERGGGEPTPRALAIGKRNDEATADRLASLQQELVAILGDEPVCLNMAEAFVADVTPAHLRAIARLADVGQIRPNRQHRVE